LASTNGERETYTQRDLLALVPLLFLALVAWLGRDAPRPHLAAGLAAAGVTAAILYLPVKRFVTHDEFADAFTIIPVLRIRERFPGLDIELAVGALAAVLLAAALFLPRRHLVAIPLFIASLLSLASISASRAIAEDATLLRDATTGPTRTWVDQFANGPVTFLYTSDLYTVAPWSLRFWNDTVANVVRLHDVYLPGPVRQPLAEPAGDGRLVVDGVAVDAEYLLASSSIEPVGTELATSGPMTLWRLSRPLRLSQIASGVRYDGTIDGYASITAYACNGGSLGFSVVAKAPQLVEVLQNGIMVDSHELTAGEGWEGTMGAVVADGTCTVALRAEGAVHAARFEFVRP